ncbi:MAG TPA: hypothetical protein VGE85_17530 [Terracidiphilus sp.]|jgi:hypothetical protein
MSAAEILRKNALRVVLITLLVSLMATLVKILFHEDFYDYTAHSYLALVCGAIGFFVSILTLVFSLKYLKGGWRVTAVIGSLLTGYWWLSDIAWWLMAK